MSEEKQKLRYTLFEWFVAFDPVWFEGLVFLAMVLLFVAVCLFVPLLAEWLADLLLGPI